MSRTGLILTAAILLASAAPAAFAQAQPAAAAPAPAERLTPRQAVASIAEVIEANYFDPARAKVLADELRAAAVKGDFDRFTEPRELIVELNNRLKSKDGHFNVTWSPNAPPPERRGGPGPGAGGPPPEYLAALRRANYGVRRVQILPGNIGYIDLSQFADIDFSDANDPARKAIDAALALTAGADAIIFDMRDNGGGSPAMVGYLSSAFTPAGADIYNTFHYRQGAASEAPDKPYPTPNLTVPVYILTSARTGSAAEAFPYTLQSARRAVVVGENTGGGANPGGSFPAAGGFAIFVSTGSPTNPITHRNWEGTGVVPDIATPASAALERAQALALQGAAARLDGPAKIDNQWALEALSPPQVSVTLADFAGDYSGVSVVNGPDGLRYVRGRRPPWALYPITADTFGVRGDTGRRIHFQRDGAGKVAALEVLTPDGPSGLYRRGG